MEIIIPQADLLPPVVASTDVTYDYETAALGGTMFRFAQAAQGLRVGLMFPSGEKFGYQFNGFVPTTRTLVGSVASFRMGGTTMSFKTINGQLKERIRWATVADANTTTTVRLFTQSCHFEQGVQGGLVVWSDLTQKVIANIAPPTITDNANRSDCPIKYVLAPDGKSVDLVVDGTWLTTVAQYPVFVDPTTTITSSSLFLQYALSITEAQHIFKMADGKLVALWQDSGTARMRRSTSTDAGATWSAGADVFTDAMDGGSFSAVHDTVGDIICGLYGYSPTGFNVYGKVFRLAYASGAFTDTNTALNFSFGGPAHWGSHAYFDTVNRRLFIVYLMNSNTGFYWSFYQCWNMTAGLTNVITESTLLANSSTQPWTYPGGLIAIGTSASPNTEVYLYNGLGTWLRYKFDGTTLTANPGTAEGGSGTGGPFDAFVNSSGQLEIVYVSGGALKFVTRTGTNTWSSTTTLKASGVTFVNFGESISMMATRNANNDCVVVWCDTTNQANGEIWYIKRINSVWGAATLLVGGASTGWATPSLTQRMYTDGIAYLVYVSGTGGSLNLVYTSILNMGATPETPTNMAPNGTANTSLTPACSAVYNNSTAITDSLSKYRVLVTRQSDSVVMWDSGSSGTAWGGATINHGGTFSIAYGGSALAKGITYQLQFQFWDASLGLAGPMNTAVTFQVNDSPAVTITSSAAPASSGPTVTWSYSQTLGHVQGSYRVRVIRLSTGAVVHDSGTIGGTAVTYALPFGTVQNLTSYTLEVTATSTDGL